VECATEDQRSSGAEYMSADSPRTYCDSKPALAISVTMRQRNRITKIGKRRSETARRKRGIYEESRFDGTDRERLKNGSEE
jgi:hypothetical protein